MRDISRNAEPPFAAAVTNPLLPGDHVKIGFCVGAPDIHPRVFDDDGTPQALEENPSAPGIKSEWMWVEITSVDKDWIRGRLKNTPCYISPIQLRAGDRVRFRPYHIYSVDYTSPMRHDVN